MKKLALVVLLLAAVHPARAQNLVTILLPLTPAQNVPGAHNSLWSTELAVENSSDRPITLFHYSCIICGAPPPPGVDVNIPPHTTLRNPPVTQNDGIGALLFAFPADAAAVRLHLRVRDMSRQAETFGTEVPVVTDAAFKSTVRLIDVPADPRFRVTLRIYAMRDGVPVVVTVLPDNGTAPLLTFNLTFDRSVQLDPVAGLIGNSAVGSAVRIVVDSPTNEPIWAFASVTNNDTQDVTTITESP